MAATKLQRNWTSVGFTPAAGVLQTITKVTNVDIDPGGKNIKFYGDGDILPDTIVTQDNEPSVSITSGDIATLLSFAPGTVGTITATHNDAKLATGGAISYTISNAVVRNNPASGPRGQFGSAVLSFDLFASDGLTNPISFTRV